ncbi:MAG: hypothetical protein P4L33_15430 [Capsulimonadaceae bacterium]|nr:hypothetical protein [Capsulimonadaceae bacterium]
MRWFPLKEGYQKKLVWVNIDQLTCIKFSIGADGGPMAYLIVSNGTELTSHDTDDLEKLQHLLQKNVC